MVSKWRPSQVKIHSFYVCNGLSLSFLVVELDKDYSLCLISDLFIALTFCLSISI